MSMMKNKTDKIIGEKTNKISTNQQDLTATSAVMTDDKAYLQDLTAKCNAKSEEWDQRSSMRTDEITALTTALSIIKGKVAFADGSKSWQVSLTSGSQFLQVGTIKSSGCSRPKSH